MSSAEAPPIGRFAAHGVLQSVAAGIVCGFLAIVLSISFSNLLFPGTMRAFVPIAIGMGLFSTMVLAVIAALTSPILGAVSIFQEIPVVAIAGPAAAIAAGLAGRAPDHEIMVTIVVAAGLATVATGAALLVLGYFKLGQLIRYVPFPVVGGFLAGTGWLILQGGISVIAGEPVGIGSLGLLLDEGTALKCGVGLVFVVLVVLLQSRSRSNLVLPVTILAALVLFNLSILIAGIPSEVLGEHGWVVPMQGGANLWPPIYPSDIGSVHWDVVLPALIMLPAIIIITVMALLMNATGIELDTGRDVDLDRELRSVGIQNVLSGAGGGLPGYPAVSLSILASRLGAANRIVGLIVAALAGGALFLGDLVLNLVPTPLLGSLLVWIGGSLIVEWLVRTAKRLALWEYLIVLLIFIVIVGVSFAYGILIGLIAAIILFVVEYGRVDSVRHVLTGQDYQSTFETSEERRESLREFGHAILIMRLQGFIFFGTSDRLRKGIEDRINGDSSVRFLIIDFRRVTGVDSSTVVSFIRLGQIATRRALTLVFTGMSGPVERALLRGGLNHEASGAIRIEPDIDHGLVWCEDKLLAAVTPTLDAYRPRDAAELAFSIVKDKALAAELVRYFESVSLSVGAHLIEEGTPSDGMYFVASGRGAVEIRGPGGASVRLATIGPGAIIGEVAFYLGKPRTASVVVEAPMVAWRFTRANLDRLQGETPAVAFRFHEGIAAVMAARLTSTNRLVGFLAN